MEWHHDGLITRRSVVRIGLPQQRRGPQGSRFYFAGPIATASTFGVDSAVAHKDPERQKAYAREWLKRFPEKARAAARKWNHANPEKRREHQRNARARDPEKFKQKLAAYHAAHPEVVRVKSVRYRARKMAASGSFSPSEWRDLIRPYRGRCGYCGAEGALHADHRVPLSRGGSNEISNIMPACASCNLRKARSSESEFRRRLLAERLASSEVMPDWWTVLLPTLERYEAG